MADAHVHRRTFLMTCCTPFAALLLAPFAVELSAQRTSRPSRRAKRRTRQEGLATFYSSSFHGEETASGKTFNQNALTAAHRTWPFGTVARVTELESGRSVVVTITDRGPFGKNRRKGAIIDLSKAAARRLKMVDDGVMRVRVDVLRWGKEAEAETRR